MKETLSYALATPYAVAKNRAGGILSRLLSRTDLELVGASMIAADEAFAKKYAGALRGRLPSAEAELLAGYAEQSLPSPAGQPRCGMLLLFRGESPCAKLREACGEISGLLAGSRGMPDGTVRGAYGEFAEEPGRASHFEPAVLTPGSQAEADEDLLMMAAFLGGRELMAPGSPGAERTLAIIKPDNWEPRSSRPGAVMDMLARPGLRIAGAKMHGFSPAQAMEFYAPVKAALREKLSGAFGRRAAGVLEREFGFAPGEDASRALAETFGAECAAREFDRLVGFMSGRSPAGASERELGMPGGAKCMILVYEGEGAVAKIRAALGPTNPADAPPGTVRGEFGASVMINAAHASDSAESYLREGEILRIGENPLSGIVLESLGAGPAAGRD